MKTYAIYNDLSGVTEMPHGGGGFATKQEALERLVEMLEGRRCEIREKLGVARRALRRHRQREG